MNQNISKRYVDVIEIVVEHPQGSGPPTPTAYCDTEEEADQYRLLRRPKTLVEVSVVYDGDVSNARTNRFERDADEYIERVAATACTCGSLTEYAERGQHVCKPCRDAAEARDPHEWVWQFKSTATNRWRGSWKSRLNLKEAVRRILTECSQKYTNGVPHHERVTAFDTHPHRILNVRIKRAFYIQVDHADPMSTTNHTPDQWYIQGYERRTKRRNSKMVWKTIGDPALDESLGAKGVLRFTFKCMDLDRAMERVMELKDNFEGVEFKLVEPATGNFIMAAILMRSEPGGTAAA